MVMVVTKPGGTETTLYEQIREAREGLPAGTGHPAKRPRSLPCQPTRFVGREEELAEIGRLLDEAECRLLTLTGPGGVGKTRLALQAAGEQLNAYADGVYFVSMASLPSTDLLAEVIAGALQVTLTAGEDPASQLLAALRSKEMLLVLDNFEHLLEGAPLLAGILQRAPQLNLLVTSRERLNLRSEWTFLVQGLPVPDPGLPAGALVAYDAVALFVQSAGRAQTGFSLTEENAGHVARICRLVDGLPLGIEMAAASVHALSCREIAQEMARSLTFLEATFRDTPKRHRNLQAVFDHSWALLSPEEQHLLQRVGVFRSGFQRRAAEAVAGASRRLLAALVDKSLLQQMPAGRYLMHALLHEYAAEKLQASGKTAQTKAAHLNYFLELAETAASQGDGTEQIEWLDRLETDNDNLRAALSWALSSDRQEAGLRLAVALYRFWYWRNHYREGRQWLEAALADSQSLPPALRAQALRTAGVLNLELNDYAGAEPYLQESLVLFRRLEDRRGVAATLNSLGVMAFSQNLYGRAIRLLEESLSLRRQLEDSYSLSTPLNNLGLVALAQEEHKAARDYFAEALALDRASGDAMGVAVSLSNLAAAMLEEGLNEEAQAYFEECLLLFQELGDQEGSAECLEGLATTMIQQENVKQATRLWGAAEALRERIHAPVHPAEKPRYDRTKAAIEARLGEAAFAAAWSEGRTMSLAQAVGEALTIR
jgi:predicted ATPase